MDDYSALAQRIAVSVQGVRGSLILSRDGLVLGAYPEGDEGLAKPAWLKFVTLGEPDKSFVEFADQVWAFVKRGGYAAFSVADAGTRPGILVDQMEQVLVEAEEGRARRDTVRLPDAANAPSGKPRTSLHPPSGKPQPSEVMAAQPPTPPQERVAPSQAATPIKPTEPTPSIAPAVTSTTPTEPAPGTPEKLPASALKKEPQKLASSTPKGGDEEESEVDRVLLAKEFSGLLQVDSDDDEGSS
ncbi:MAG TPA: hypothetical protein VI341_11170 [Actinomycetota bacterium]